MKKILLTAFIALMSAVMACEPASDVVANHASPASSALAVDGDRLLIASPDHNQVLVVSRDTKEVLKRIDMSTGPEHIIVDGEKAYVTARYDHVVDVIDLQSATKLPTAKLKRLAFALPLMLNRVKAMKSSNRAFLARSAEPADTKVVQPSFLQ